MKVFTKEEVAKYNGKNGNLAYIIYKGKIYDVTASFLWRDGTHQVLHNAGVDLTEAMEQAPHGGDVLEKFPVVGILQGAGMSCTHLNLENLVSIEILIYFNISCFYFFFGCV